MACCSQSSALKCAQARIQIAIHDYGLQACEDQGSPMLIQAAEFPSNEMLAGHWIHLHACGTLGCMPALSCPSNVSNKQLCSILRSLASKSAASAHLPAVVNVPAQIPSMLCQTKLARKIRRNHQITDGCLQLLLLQDPGWKEAYALHEVKQNRGALEQKSCAPHVMSSYVHTSESFRSNHAVLQACMRGTLPLQI